MSNNAKKCLNLFLVGFVSGIAISFPVLLPFYILSYYYFIRTLVDSKFLIQGYLQGWLFGIGFFFSSMHWIVNPFLIYEEHLILAPFVIIIFPLAMGIFFSISGILVRVFVGVVKIDKNYFYTKCFFIGFFLFLSEYLRSIIFGGLPFNLHSHLWIFDERFISITSYIGVFGLSFLTILWITLITLYIEKRRISYFLILICFPLSLFLTSLIELEINKDKPDTALIRVIQPNIPQNEKWNRSLFEQHLSKLLELTKSENDDEMIVIWPEAAMTLYLNENLDLVNFIKKNIKDNTTIITGGLRRVFSNDEFRIYNSLYVINNKEFDYYDKKKLVPFGEFIPLRAVLDFAKLTPGNTDFDKGTKKKLIELEYRKNIIHSEPSICYEAIFQSFNYKEIDLMINITNDAWFGKTTGPRQHLTSSIFRAVEKGVPLVRSANSGISVIVNSKGKTLGKININESGFFQQEINLGRNSTFFMKYENKIIYNLILVIFLSVFLLDFSIKKRKDLKILRF